MEFPYTIPLTKKIKHGSDVITELVMEREPCAGDIRSLSGSDVGGVIDVMGVLCNQPPAIMNKLSLKDLGTVSDIFNSFL